MKSKEHQYSITSKRGEASYPKERLFICTPDSSAKAEVEVEGNQELSAMGNMEETSDLSLDKEFNSDMFCAIAGKSDNILLSFFMN